MGLGSGCRQPWGRIPPQTLGGEDRPNAGSGVWVNTSRMTARPCTASIDEGFFGATSFTPSPSLRLRSRLAELATSQQGEGFTLPLEGSVGRRRLAGGRDTRARPLRCWTGLSVADVLLAGLDQPALVGENDCLGAVAQAELGEHAVDVRFHGRPSDEQLF